MITNKFCVVVTEIEIMLDLFQFSRLVYLHSIFLQYVTEKMGAAEGTKMDDDFVEMERVGY